VVFATVDKNLGRSGHRAFIVEKSTPGFEILKIEEKMGIKAYETASFALNNCRVPEANLLGGEEYYNRESSGGFGGAMKTFNATRPIVASMAVGIARAAFDVANNFVNTEYPKHSFQRLDRIKGMLSEMQQHIIFARLMCLKAAWLMDNHKSNSLEASQAKLFAPSLCLKVTNLAREILAEAGIDRDYLVEKFARDVKAIDIVEGTKQIQNLVVSRHLFGRQFL
jgi:acyl-CoA dehydrogenase